MWIEIRIQSDDPGTSGSSLPAPRFGYSTGVSADAGTYPAVQPVRQLEYCDNDSSAAPSIPTSSVSGVYAPGSGALRSHANDESTNGADHQTVILVRTCYLPLDRGKVPSISSPLDALKTAQRLSQVSPTGVTFCSWRLDYLETCNQSYIYLWN